MKGNHQSVNFNLCGIRNFNTSLFSVENTEWKLNTRSIRSYTENDCSEFRPEKKNNCDFPLKVYIFLKFNMRLGLVNSTHQKMNFVTSTVNYNYNS